MPYKSGRMPNNRIGKKQVVRYCHILIGSLQWQKRMPPLCFTKEIDRKPLDEKIPKKSA